MLMDLYQEYLFIIGKVKDVYKLDVDVDHKDIHTFFWNKHPIFKLFYGKFNGETEHSIVVSFHIDLLHHEAIKWFSNLYQIHPLLKIYDSFIIDSNGETHTGEDAFAIKEIFMTQNILADWLEKTREEITEFTKAKVVGKKETPPVETYGNVEAALKMLDTLPKPDSEDGFQ